MPYYTYILANRTKTLYIGVTNDLQRRMYEHKKKMIPGFTKKYNLTLLVHFEFTDNIEAAISREKQIKGWIRQKKIDLINRHNSEWRDLSEDWFK